MQEMYVVLIFSSYTQLLSTVIVYTMTISLSGLVMVYYQPHAIVHKYDLYKLWTANYINFVIFWQITWAEFKVKQSMMKLWDLAWMKSNTFNEASLHLATTFGFCDYLWLGAFFETILLPISLWSWAAFSHSGNQLYCHLQKWL